VPVSLDWNGDNNKKLMMETLEKLATSGFVALEKRNPIANTLSKFGVGGVVSMTSEVIGHCGIERKC
jgi:hypothetical protein